MFQKVQFSSIYIVRYCSTNSKILFRVVVVFFCDNVRTVLTHIGSEIERSISFDLHKSFCEVDFIRLRSAIERLSLI